MNKIGKMILALFIAVTCSAFQVYAEIDDVIPVGWFKTGSSAADYLVGIDSSISTQGEHSSFIASKSTIGSGFGSLAQTAGADEYLSQRVEMTISIKSQKVKERAAAWFRVDTNNGGRTDTFSMDNMRNRPIKGTNDWTRYSLVLDVPHNAVSIYYGVLLKGKGKVWFDNVKLEIVDSSTPLTATFFGSGKTHKPRNLSFENED